VGENWTVAVTLAHIAFWDERVLAILDATEREGKAFIHTIDIIVNDIVLPLLLAIPPREAVRIALQTAEKLDQRLATFSPELLEQIASVNIRFINRNVHRGTHLDEIEQALNS
jgi:hypothetical protein